MTTVENVREKLLEEEGIPYSSNWSLKYINALSKLKYGFNIKSLYNFNQINKITISRTRANQASINYNRSRDKQSDLPFQELDETMWEEFATTLENARIFVFDSFKEFGIEEGEAYFLSLKFLQMALSKFRLEMRIQMGRADSKEAKQEFNVTAIRNAVNVLGSRIHNISIHKDYLFDKIACDPKIEEFKSEAAKETAKELIDTGIVIFTKLTLYN